MVLEGLGWSILRIWSTDWWYDSGKCIDKLNRELEALLAAPQEAVGQATKVVDTAESIAENGESNSNGNDIDLLQENLPPVENPQLYDPTVVEISPIGEFFGNATLVGKQMEGLVQALAPVSREECFSTVSRSWGFARRGNRIDQFLEPALKISIKLNPTVKYSSGILQKMLNLWKLFDCHQKVSRDIHQLLHLKNFCTPFCLYFRVILKSPKMYFLRR